jgi:hypothetical protein
MDRVTTACRLELDASALEGAPPSESALHDSLSLWYRLWAPANRTIDGGLAHHGARDDTRITDECIDESVGQWRAKYATAPMPVVNKHYVPANVLEYEERIEEQASTPPVQAPDYPSDLRETALPRQSR